MSTLPPSDIPRPLGFVPLGVFFYFGSFMAAFAAVTLLKPGTILDRAWDLNPGAHADLTSMGRVMGFPFVFLSLGLLQAGLGWFKRERSGWTLGTSVIAINFATDIIQVARGNMKNLVGVAIAGLLLVYLTRPGVRGYFSA